MNLNYTFIVISEIFYIPAQRQRQKLCKNTYNVIFGLQRICNVKCFDLIESSIEEKNIPVHWIVSILYNVSDKIRFQFNE